MWRISAIAKSTVGLPGFSPISFRWKKEIQLGAQLAMEMDRTARFVEDPVVVECPERLVGVVFQLFRIIFEGVQGIGIQH